MELVLEDIGFKAVKAAALALADKVLQERSLHNVNVEGNVHFTAHCRSCENVVNNVVVVNAENRLSHSSLG